MLKKIKKIFLFFFFGILFFSFSSLSAEEDSSGSGNFASPEFMIDTSGFSFWKDKENQDKNSEQLLNYTLGNIIQKLMIGLGIVSFIVLVIGAGFMILAGGQDEYNNRGKSIFTAGILSLIAALSSYYLVAIVRFLVF